MVSLLPVFTQKMPTKLPESCMNRPMSARSRSPIAKILAVVGIADDHHKPNTPISSQSTLDAINRNAIIYLDGKEHPFQCSLSPTCKLGSALIFPLRAGDRVIGTIKLYEPKRKLFSTINMSMAPGIAQLLSSQILYGEYQQNKSCSRERKSNCCQRRLIRISCLTHSTPSVR